MVVEKKLKKITMVHSSSLKRLSSILRNSCCNCSQNNLDMESQSQIVPRPPVVKIHGVVACDSIIVANNNNYLTRPVETNERDSKLTRWSSNSNWTRMAPLTSTSPSDISPTCRRWNWCVATTAVVILISCVVIGTLFSAGHPYFYYQSKSSGNRTMKINSTSPGIHIDLPLVTKRVTLTPSQIKQRNVNISKHAWFALQRNDARQLNSRSDEEMTFFSTSKDKVHRIPCGGPPPRTSCCRLQKSIGVLELPGCRSIEVPKHECIGACDYVYVEGNTFVSIPQCQPVKTRRLKVKVSCGDKVRRTSVDIVSRCGCA